MLVRIHSSPTHKAHGFAVLRYPLSNLRSVSIFCSDFVRPNMSFTPTIERRFRLLFRFYDLDKDGCISSKDHDELIKKLTGQYNTDAADVVKKESDKWWAMVEKINVKKVVSEDEYINIVRYLYVNDFRTFRKLGFKLYEATFSLIDHNKDDKISVDELIKFYACFNVTDTDRVKKIFKKLDLDEDGFVTRDEWIIARLDYATRDDPDHDFGFMIDFSSPVPENHSTGRFTRNLLKRYKRSFRFYDVNKDGFHTSADYIQMCDNFCDLHKMEEKKRAGIKQEAMQWWKFSSAIAIDGKISEEHYVYLLITRLITDFDKRRHILVLVYRRWFRFADANGDGLLSQDEFLKFYAACNIKDMDKVTKIFKQLDLDDDGFISEEEWILAHLDYWTRDDSTFDYGFLYDVE